MTALVDTLRGVPTNPESLVEYTPDGIVSRTLKDGSYELKLSYADDRELVMDVLKYGAHCKVVGPKALRDKVAAELARAGTQYRN